MQLLASVTFTNDLTYLYSLPIGCVGGQETKMDCISHIFINLCY